MAEKNYLIFPTEEELKEQSFVFNMDEWIRGEKSRGFGLNTITAAWGKVYAAKCDGKKIRQTSHLLVASSRWSRRLPPRKIAAETPSVRLGRVARKISATEWHALYPQFLTAVLYNFPQYLAEEGGAL